MTPEQETTLMELVAGTHTQVTTILTNCMHCQKQLTEHHVTLYGNTKPGLRQDVGELMARVRLLQTDSETDKTWYQNKLGYVIVALLGLVAALSGVKQLEAWFSPPAVQQEGQ